MIKRPSVSEGPTVYLYSNIIYLLDCLSNLLIVICSFYPCAVLRLCMKEQCDSHVLELSCSVIRILASLFFVTNDNVTSSLVRSKYPSCLDHSVATSGLPHRWCQYHQPWTLKPSNCQAIKWLMWLKTLIEPAQGPKRMKTSPDPTKVDAI